MSLSPGDRFGRYEIAALLGQGGMGIVYRAQDTLLHRRVALKILLGSAASAGSEIAPSDGAARLLREARAAAGIEHPNAISIYDVGEVDGVPFLAMEFIAGKTLRPLIGDASIPLGRRIRWLVDVAKALGAAHALGLVHRDVKPENVMVRDDGIVKVLDFGIARRAPAKADPSAATEAAALGTLTADGGVVGTPSYMPPEQMRGEAIDGRADQFAWGVLAYELLTGRRPWDEGSAVQLVAQILTREVEPLRATNPDVPTAVDAAIRRALAKEAGARYAQMADIAESIEGYAASERSPAAETGGRVSVPASRGMASVPVTVSPNHMRRAGAEAERAPRVSRGRLAGLVGVVLALGGLGWLLVPRLLANSPGAVVAAADAARPATLDSQMSPVLQATAAYRSGMQAFRDGSLDLAKEQFDRALSLDPSFAAARLRRALLPYEDRRPTQRGDLQSARSARQDLGAHDRTLLEAMEPWTRVPPDMKESARRLRAAQESEPANADYAFQLGWVLYDAYDSEGADVAFDAALAADPTFAMAWRMKARTRVITDDDAGAMRAYARCLEVSANATSCLDDLATLQGNDGDCSGMATTLRKLIAISPDNPSLRRSLAAALFAGGEPRDAVFASLAQSWERLPPDARDLDRLDDETAVALLSGHFGDADRKQRAVEAAYAAETSETMHFIASYDRVLLSMEIGRYGDAAGFADDYVRGRSAWQSADVQADPVIGIYAFQKRAGRLSNDAFGKLRDAWLAEDRNRIERVGLVARAYEGTDWAWAFALPVENASEAAAALGVRPQVRPLIDGWTETSYLDEPIGRAYLLAGHHEEAIAVLTRASRSCAVLAPFAPVFTTWATFELGEAFEATGDKSRACDAYGRVIQRWGEAKPPSKTALSAREHARAVGCRL